MCFAGVKTSKGPRWKFKRREHRKYSLYGLRFEHNKTIIARPKQFDPKLRPKPLREPYLLNYGGVFQIKSEKILDSSLQMELCGCDDQGGEKAILAQRITI